MTDVGDSVEQVEALLEELTVFQKSSRVCILNLFYFPRYNYFMCTLNSLLGYHSY